MHGRGNRERKRRALPGSAVGVMFIIRVLRMDSEIFQCVVTNTVLDLSTIPCLKVKDRIPELLCNVLGMPHWLS